MLLVVGRRYAHGRPSQQLLSVCYLRQGG